MEVWVPPGELVGEIIQEFCVNGSKFGVYNRHLQVIYRIEGPGSLLCGSRSKDTHFRVGNARDKRNVEYCGHLHLKKLCCRALFKCS